MHKFTLFLFIFLFIACTDSTLVKPIENTTESYVIGYDDVKYGKRSIIVYIDSAILKENVKIISDSIIFYDDNKSSSIMIDFFVKTNMKSDHYATTTKTRGHYTSTNYVERKEKMDFTGMTLQSAYSDDVAQAVVRLYKRDSDGEYFLYSLFPDQSELIEELEVKNRNGQKTFNVISDDTEYIIIKNDGLYIYDMYGDLGLKYRRL